MQTAADVMTWYPVVGLIVAVAIAYRELRKEQYATVLGAGILGCCGGWMWPLVILAWGVGLLASVLIEGRRNA